MVWIRTVFFRLLPYVKIIFTMIWLSNLASTDAYFSVYVLIAFLSFFLQIQSFRKDNVVSHSETIGPWIFSFIFSLFVLLANYPIFTTLGDPAFIGRGTSILVNLINTAFSFVGGIVVSYPIFCFFFHHFPQNVRGSSINNRKWMTLGIFGSIFCINLIHLFLVEFPGNATEDTFTQIGEMVSGSYSNFNTFWHTMIFQGILSLGYAVFSDMNMALSCFCIFQILILSAAFTYCLTTLQDYGVPKVVLVGVYLIYAAVPYNIALSITIWKDVLFAAGTLLMITAWLRIIWNLGKKRFLNDVLFCCGSLLFLLSRTNGWVIYLITFVLVLLFFRNNKRFLAMMGTLAVTGCVLLNPVLSLLNVPNGDVVESLSIPIQQVSRVIADGYELSDEEEMLLSRIVDIEEVPLLYTDWLSDPMKEEIRGKDPAYFEDNIEDYLKLWIRLGVKHPWAYLKAWVDQTKGYWNAGYDYALYSETITDNPYGVEKTGGGNLIAALFHLYFGLSRHVIFFEPLHSIGLHVWIVILCFAVNVAKKRKEFLLSVPLLILVVGLWFGTPVYCCFRYVYPLFVSFPLILSTTLFAPQK